MVQEHHDSSGSLGLEFHRLKSRCKEHCVPFRRLWDEATLEFTQVVGQIQYFVIITIVPVCLLAVSWGPFPAFGSHLQFLVHDLLHFQSQWLWMSPSYTFNLSCLFFHFISPRLYFPLLPLRVHVLILGQPELIQDHLPTLRSAIFSHISSISKIPFAMEH